MAERSGKIVLLAEDSAVTQDIVKLVLGQRGHDVVIANDGQEALDVLLSQSFDLALIDFHLPVMTGLDAVKQFLDQREGEMVPRLVALTGDTQGLLAADNNAKHFDLVISKPFKIDEIIPIIEAEESKAMIRTSSAEGALADSFLEESDREMPYADLNLNFVYFPRDFFGSFRNAVSMRLTSNGAPDGIIIEKEPKKEHMRMIARLRRTREARS